MADQLYLSLRVRGFNESNMMRHFERVLSLFPFSRLAKQPGLLRVWAVSSTEPPLIEKPLDPPLDIQEALTSAKEFQTADCATEIEGYWDLWQFDGEWKLLPARVTISCFGPLFEDEPEDHIRIALGFDSLFLPNPDAPNAVYTSKSNVASLLRLSKQLRESLVLEHPPRLWTESGENFADRLTQAVQDEY